MVYEVNPVWVLNPPLQASLPKMCYKNAENFLNHFFLLKWQDFIVKKNNSTKFGDFLMKWREIITQLLILLFFL